MILDAVLFKNMIVEIICENRDKMYANVVVVM